MKKSWIALILAIGIMLTSLPLNAFAEDEALPAPQIEYEVEDVDGDTGVPGLVIGEDAGDDEPLPEIPEMSEPEADEPQDAEEDAGDHVINSVADDPGFIMGYVRVLAGANTVVDADGRTIAKNLPEGAVLYAFNRDLEDRIAVCFDTDSGIVQGWVAATVLYPLDADETRAFLESDGAQAADAWFDAGKTLPLMRLHIEYNDHSIDNTDETESEASDPTEHDGEEVSGKPDDADPENSGEAKDDTEKDAQMPDAYDDAAQTVAASGEAREASAMALYPDSLTLGVKEKSVALRVMLGDAPYEGSVSFTSSDPKVATVNAASGVVTGVKKGAATVTATLENGETLTCVVNVLAEPTKVTVTPSSAKLSVGMSFQLVPEVKAGQACSTYKFGADYPKIASVDANGVVTANSAGTTRIYAKTYNGQRAACTVTVSNAPESLVIPADEINIGVGMTAAIAADARDGKGKSVPGGMTYAFLSGEDCATVDATGNVVGVREGTAVIRVTDYVGHTVDCTVNVLPAPASIEFEDDTPLVLGVGETCKLPAIRALSEAGDDRCMSKLTWASSNEKIVKIVTSGNCKAVKKGEADITVTDQNGLTAVLHITVLDAPTKVMVSPTSAKVSVGMSFQVVPAVKAGQACSEYKFSSDKATVASVDANGVVTANAAGTAKIVVKTYNGQKVGCTVTVCNAPESLVIPADEINIGVGMTASIGADARDSKGKSVPGGLTYAFLSGSDCATVDEAGNVVGVREGTAVIRVTDYLGHTVDCTVNVLPAPASIEFEDDTPLVLGVGESYRLPEVIALSKAGDDHCAAQLTWSTSNEKIVKIVAPGTCKAVNKGAADITVTDQNGLSATISITVKPAPNGITAVPAKLTMGIGETAQLEYKLSGGVSGHIGWISSNGDVASVDENGKVEALSKGNAAVTVSTFNQKKSKVAITVKDAPEWIALDAEEIVLGVGETRKLTASVTPGAGGRIDWSYGDAVSVNDNGEVKGVAPGETEIVVRTYNGHEAACRVTVLPAPEAISLPYAGGTLFIGVGDTEQLMPDLGGAAGAITYSSNNSRIASVNNKGVVKGVNPGTAYVTLKTYNKKTYKLKVVVRKAPGKVTATPASKELGLGESFRVGYVLPAGTEGTVTFDSTDESVLNVDPRTGEVTTVGQGEARVRVRTHNGKESWCDVAVYDAPDSIEVEEGFVELGVGQTSVISPSIPEGSRSAITYESMDPDVVKVSDGGVITAVGRGSAGVRVCTFVPGVETLVSVTVWDAPAWVKLEETSKTVNVDEAFDLAPTIPEDSMSAFTFTSSDERVATVSNDGHVVARQRGTTRITVSTYNNQKAVLELTVFDPWYPEALYLMETVTVLDVGDEYQVQYEVLPESARPNLVWTSSNEKVATVDQQGYIRCVGYGYTSIRAVSEKNSDLSIEFTLGVQTSRLTLVIPLRQTNIAGIPANLERIDAVRASAIGEINELYRGGVITKADADKRKTIVNNAFRIYAFPWMTPTKQKYWKAANSEGGVKDFKPDRVYYGLPYISGSYRGRCFNVDKALKENYYTDTGKGYYMMNQSKKLDGSYVGNDCSGFCNVCIWGTNSSHTDDRTADIGVSSAYKTVSFNDLRPGDLICKRYAHVVMFLYYANPEHTKIMMIENGGAEAGTNTVHCDVYDLSYYKNRGYSVRRLKTLG